MAASLLSPEAERLLAILTPEPIPVSPSQYNHAAVRELERLGLIEAQGWGAAVSVRLTANGRALRPPVNN